VGTNHFFGFEGWHNLSGALNLSKTKKKGMDLYSPPNPPKSEKE